MISFITVTYNSESTIFQSVEAIVKSCTFEYEIIIIDNNSPKRDYLNKLANMENVKLVRLEINYGFSKANNIGFDLAKGDVVFFVNPDCILNGYAIESLYNKVNERNDIVATTTLVDEYGRKQNSIFTVPIIKEYFKRLIGSKYLYWFHGALVVAQKSVFESIGVWSEDFFMYAEDLDLCYKAQLHGLELDVLDLGVIHIGGTSTSTVWSELERAKVVESSNFKFYKKYNKLPDFYFIMAINILKSLRFGLSETKNLILVYTHAIKGCKDAS